MELDKFFTDYSPIKFVLNKNVIDNMQSNNPVILDYDDIAYNKLRGKLAELFNVAQKKSTFVYSLPDNFLKVFFISFIILFLVSDKLVILHDYNNFTKEKKAKVGRIVFISLVISLIFIFYLTKRNVQSIITEMFG